MRITVKTLITIKHVNMCINSWSSKTTRIFLLDEVKQATESLLKGGRNCPKRRWGDVEIQVSISEIACVGHTSYNTTRRVAL